jgi:hypothetical protein
MSEQYDEGSELDECEEVFDVIFPSGDEASEVVHPCEEPLYFPASAVAAQLPSVLGLLFAVSAVGRDHLDAVPLGHLLIQGARVVGLVANRSLGQLIEEASGQNSFHKLTFGM